MDRDIEEKVRTCVECQTTRPVPAQAPLHPWQWPEQPWARVHIDFAGPFLGHMFLLLIDAHSKWLEVSIMKTSTTKATIENLCTTFAQLGVIVSDNGPYLVRSFRSLFVETESPT